ncbi:MAG: SDR family oxidoreductase [Scytolyngbya sp. HA4215-MV1]|jgi:NAD(P)-dependent dehydrogenase (short-subunit alcohol dehydrogenase family)|nr:SDR family oxidoreductase [Scytolyngbya sp. HA4215-MV1]
MARLTGKVTLITGIASSIGQAAARLFTAEGASVFGVDGDRLLGEALAAELQEQQRSFQFWAADLADSAAIAETIARCQQTFGRVDVLYNNASISMLEPFNEVSLITLERMMAINFRATFSLCQHVIPGMKRRGGGVIINTASEGASVAQPHLTAYSASQGAVLALTRALALEYARDNIRINALCPGAIESNQLNQEFALAPDPASAKQARIATIPIGRLGQPEEIAKVALFLASEAPSLMQGTSLIVDGGSTTH